MNNNEILVRKAIEDKEREANSYEDQGCYNAAYCYGYAAGASDALSTLKQPDPKELFIILSYYSNEDDGEFDRVGSCDKVYPTLEAAKAAADKLFKEDKENRPRTSLSLTPLMIASAISRKTRCMLSGNGKRTLLEAITISTQFSAFLSPRTKRKED